MLLNIKQFFYTFKSFFWKKTRIFQVFFLYEIQFQNI